MDDVNLLQIILDCLTRPAAIMAARSVCRRWRRICNPHTVMWPRTYIELGAIPEGELVDVPSEEGLTSFYKFLSRHQSTVRCITMIWEYYNAPIPIELFGVLGMLPRLERLSLGGEWEFDTWANFHLLPDTLVHLEVRVAHDLDLEVGHLHRLRELRIAMYCIYVEDDEVPVRGRRLVTVTLGDLPPSLTKSFVEVQLENGDDGVDDRIEKCAVFAPKGPSQPTLELYMRQFNRDMEVSVTDPHEGYRWQP